MIDASEVRVGSHLRQIYEMSQDVCLRNQRWGKALETRLAREEMGPSNSDRQASHAQVICCPDRHLRV